MSSPVELGLPLDEEVLATRRSLNEAFGADFDLWMHNGDSWLLAVPSTSAGVATRSPASLEQFRDASSPQISVGRDGTQTLAIPLTIRMSPMVALAEPIVGDPDQLLGFAQLAARDQQQRREIARLKAENQAFLCQVTNDFEELVFLRNMADLLKISELSFDFVAMAKTVLPTLQPLCEADSMVLVTARTEDQPDCPQVTGPRLWFGVRSVDDQTCTRLVEHYRQDCRTQPVVRNHFDRTPEGEQFPGIHSFVIVPIVNGEMIIGWMLALNRNNERNLYVQEITWDVSYLEFGTHEATLMSSTAAVLATHAHNVELFREREDLLVGMVRALVSAIEAKDQYTRGHSERVALYGKRLAEELGFGPDECERLYLTGLLHDIGKIGVRDAVLCKPGPLTDDEFEEIKQHPDKGWEILQDLEQLNYVLPGVLHHHEQMDGNGYPDQLKGAEIPQAGRILAVADAYDAMTSDRPYRSGMSHGKAEAILRRGACTQWDREVLNAFFRVMPDIQRIKKAYQPRAAAKRPRRSHAATTSE